MKKLNPTDTLDMMQRIDAIATLVGQINAKQASQISSDLPNRKMLKQLIDMSKDIKDNIDAANFLDMTKQLLQSVTSAETQKVLDMTDYSAADINKKKMTQSTKKNLQENH